MTRRADSSGGEGSSNSPNVITGNCCDCFRNSSSGRHISNNDNNDGKTSFEPGLQVVEQHGGAEGLDVDRNVEAQMAGEPLA